MSKLETKMALLDSAVVNELSHMKDKFNFYQIGQPEAVTLHEGPNPLTLEKTLSMISPTDPDLFDHPDFGLLYGIAWEFIWGQKAPTIVQEMRESLINKVRDGHTLTTLEIIWINLIRVDTDMF